MPQSKKRPGHHPHQKPAAIPARQRTNGSTIWALLFAIFGCLIALFAVGSNYVALAIGAIAGGAIGYIIGKKMEEDSSKD
jgi:hypothetical protein